MTQSPWSLDWESGRGMSESEAGKAGKNRVLKPCGHIRVGEAFPKGVNELLRGFEQTKD